ncbi:MAG: hypothetical protein WC057_09440, partial [Dehalococcoidales bacterium]
NAMKCIFIGNMNPDGDLVIVGKKRNPIRIPDTINANIPNAVPQCWKKPPPSCLTTCPSFGGLFCFILLAITPKRMPAIIDTGTIQGIVSNKTESKKYEKTSPDIKTIKKDIKTNKNLLLIIHLFN